MKFWPRNPSGGGRWVKEYEHWVAGQERLKQQREEAKNNPSYRDNFKPQSTKEDRQAKRKQLLANIGSNPCLVRTFSLLTPLVMSPPCDFVFLLLPHRTQADRVCSNCWRGIWKDKVLKLKANGVT